MSKPRYFITDVFTSRKYGGNQLATFIDCESLADGEMQKIAREINFSETTFITSAVPRNGAYDVRIFTPNAEVDFAGHPTLGTAYIIREKLRLTTASDVSLNLRIGMIPVTFSEAPGGVSQLWMKQASPEYGSCADVDTLAGVMGITATDIVSDLPIEEVSTGFPTLIVPVASLSALRRIQINRDKYNDLVNDAWAKVILAFCREGYEQGQDLGVRVFADFYGIPEDAATGSSNGSLAAYLSRHLLAGSPDISMIAGQGYDMGRPSVLALRTSRNADTLDVFVGGCVVEVAEGVWG